MPKTTKKTQGWQDDDFEDDSTGEGSHEEPEELEVDDDMPADDDESDEEGPTDGPAIDDTSDDDDQPADDWDDSSTVSVPAVKVEKTEADQVMDLVEGTWLEDANAVGDAFFLGPKQIVAVRKEDDGWFTVWKAKGSIPGKAFERIDGAAAITRGPSKARLSFPISWVALEGGVFTAKVWAFEHAEPDDQSFSLKTDLEGHVEIRTHRENFLDLTEFDRLNRCANWVLAAAKWFETNRSGAEGEDDGE